MITEHLIHSKSLTWPGISQVLWLRYYQGTQSLFTCPVCHASMRLPSRVKAGRYPILHTHLNHKVGLRVTYKGSRANQITTLRTWRFNSHFVPTFRPMTEPQAMLHREPNSPSVPSRAGTAAAARNALPSCLLPAAPYPTAISAWGKSDDQVLDLHKRTCPFHSLLPQSPVHAQPPSYNICEMFWLRTLFWM